MLFDLFRAPMAIGVIGGLAVSTVLSLVFVPSFFVIVDSLSHFMARLFAPLIGPVDEPDAPAPPGHAPGAVRPVAAE